MKSKISALMDGEAAQHEISESLGALARDREALECWRVYHAIGDAMRGCGMLSRDFGGRLAERLSEEPTVLAPRRLGRERNRWIALSAAASVAAVALVGWLAYAPHQTVAPLAQQATVAPQVASSSGGAVVEANVKIPVHIPLPSSTNDYLLAHQAYSPRINLQGMAPYVRTVSDEAVGSASR